MRIHFCYKERFYKQLTLKNVTYCATFRTESFSISSNIEFQIFQKYFQNVHQFSINPIKYNGVSADSCNQRMAAVILGLFNISSSFCVECHTEGGVQFLFFRGFLPVLAKFSFRGIGDWRWVIILWSFEIFVFSCLAIPEETRIRQVITNNHASFDLW